MPIKNTLWRVCVADTMVAMQPPGCTSEAVLMKRSRHPEGTSNVILLAWSSKSKSVYLLRVHTHVGFKVLQHEQVSS